MSIETLNPATGDLLKNYPLMDWPTIENHLDMAQKAQKEWSSKLIHERLGKIKTLANVLRDHRERFAKQITLEMGKCQLEARAEIDKCALMCDTFIQYGPTWLKEEMIPLDGIWHKVRFEPLGNILGVMPWNFPFWQAIRFAIPALIVGNGVLLRHASNVTGCALMIEEAFKLAAFAPGLFQTVVCSHESVKKLIADHRVHGLSFTGSTEVGRGLAAHCGQELKKCVMELGGSDPFVVFDDADLEKASKAAVTSRFLNAGQSCINAKRFLVSEKIEKDFCQLFVQKLQKKVVGDPLDLLSEIGPLVSEKAALELENWAQEAIQKGAEVLLQGKREGAYLHPYVLKNVPKDCQLSCQEIFGPIAVIETFKTPEEAITLANSTCFGLSASVWSMNLDFADKQARLIESGSVFINSFSKSDPRMPFGGVKASGMGREMSRYGLLEFANIKSYSAYL